MRAFDDPADRAAVAEGIRLYRAGPQSCNRATIGEFHNDVDGNRAKSVSTLMQYYFLLLVALSACAPRATQVGVLIFNRSEDALADIRVISGGDKVYIKQIHSGADKRVTLNPGRTSDYQITLFYTLLDDPTIWSSDRLPAGTDYFVEVSVTREGVKARYCAQPCK